MAQENKKKKILFLSDHPLVPSGVGLQAKLLIEGLLATGKYSFICLGGAIKHPSMQPQKVHPEKYGDDWLIFPVEGHGSQQIVRQFLLTDKPDAVIMFTDPRFFLWLWDIEDEVRAVCPLLYWHVWDSDPTPKFNEVLYQSTDHIVALSLKTKGMLDDMGYERCSYIPHAVSAENFKPLPDNEITEFRKKWFGPHADKKFVVFWNNRNARRKRTGDVIGAFAKFAEKVGKNNVALMMHTHIFDPEGQNVLAVADCYGVKDLLIISEERQPSEWLNSCYNAVDATINISDNEGFGLGTLESLSSGTPIVVNFTGGLQYQIGDWWNELNDFTDQKTLTTFALKRFRSKKGKWWGVPVFPASRSCTGSQQIPYIYSDFVSHEDVANALLSLYNMGRKQRKQLGLEAREWVTKNFNEQKLIADWDSVISLQVEKFKNTPHKKFRIKSV